jgi:C-terminal processing protease CtpA/Prc
VPDSRAEAFARYFQREKRAIVVGDRTSGQLTAARMFAHRMGVDIAVAYGIQVAVGRWVFPGGEEVEKLGVEPDVKCIPTEDDLRAHRDRCLSMALSLARKDLSLPEKDESAPTVRPD